MGIRAQGNPLASFLDVWSNTGLDAVGDYALPPGASTNPDGHTATGGIISDWIDPSPGNVYRTHIFTSSGTFDVSALSGTYPAAIEYLVVAGGGGAGSSGTYDRSGGGGAGGFRTNVPGHPLAGSSFPVSTSPGSYTVTVGGGGAGGSGTGPTVGGSTQNGNPSVFSSITSTAGGGGGSGHGTTAIDEDGAPGGSGGGAGYLGPGGGGSGPPYDGNAGSGNTPPASPSQGFNGGTGQGGGGGGATAVGSNGPDGAGGAGSPIAIETSTAKTYATGGSGGASTPAAAGAPGTGDGGDCVLNGAGYGGGSGIVAVRYQIGTLAPAAKATGGAISRYNNKWIHTFVNSGTFVTGSTWTSENIEYVVIGGGAAGGGNAGGGGGAGAYKKGTTPVSGTGTSVTVQVGGGGAKRAPGTSERNGTSSYFGTPITSPGGGHGANSNSNGGSGGSGGGGNSSSSDGDPFPGNLADSVPGDGWGHDGGTQQGVAADRSLGGGGGAGGGGQNAQGPTEGGDGGAGIQIPATFRNPEFVNPSANKGFGGVGPTSAPTPNGFDTSGNFWFAGGGGGSSHYIGPNPGGTAGGSPAYGSPYAGAGAGGNGNFATCPPDGYGRDALQNTGSGGGAGAGGCPSLLLGGGGSGIVLIAYST